MAKQYNFTRLKKLENVLLSIGIRRGFAPKGMHILRVKGRKSGLFREMVIDPIVVDGNRWLVAPFGVVKWVKNVRRAGEVWLSKGKKTEHLKLREANAQESAPVLKAYLNRGYTGSYFDAKLDSPLPEFEAEADRHPVFEVVEATDVSE
ncbi:MAG: nitroreductase family deazaflavin-dependent oxidoreductase [Chloroflexi bacterium]|nr:nitroreductase family deazaflavin-dependent oxidoreductase [Chloroflexota bacterium]